MTHVFVDKMYPAIQAVQIDAPEQVVQVAGHDIHWLEVVDR